MKTTLTYLLLALFLFTNAQLNEETTITRIDSINRILEKHSITSSEKFENLGILIDLYLSNNDIEKLEEINEKIYSLALLEKNEYQLAISYKANAIIHHLKGELNSGISDFKKSIITLNNIKSHKNKRAQLQSIYYLLAQTYTEINNYGDASNNVLKSLNYLPKNNDSIVTYNKIDAYNLLGFINSEIENNSIALENLKKALVLENEVNDEYGKANTYNLMGIIYSKQKNEVKALEYYELALDIGKKLGKEFDISSLYNNIGISYYELNDYLKAREMLLKSIEIGNKTYNEGLLADSHLYLGKTFIAESKIDLGLINIEKSMRYAKNNSQSIMIENLISEI